MKTVTASHIGFRYLSVEDDNGDVYDSAFPNFRVCATHDFGGVLLQSAPTYFIFMPSAELAVEMTGTCKKQLKEDLHATNWREDTEMLLHATMQHLALKEIRKECRKDYAAVQRNMRQITRAYRKKYEPEFVPNITKAAKNLMAELNNHNERLDNDPRYLKQQENIMRYRLSATYGESLER